MRFVACILLLLLQPLVFAVETIPADDENYIYGLGIDLDHSNAQKLALADITQKLSTRIQSSVGISQHKTGNSTTTSTKQQTLAVSQEIELPNIQVINNSKIDHKWRVLVRVERKLVQLSLKQQLESINDELMFIIEDFSESQGPACWHALSKNNHKKEKLAALIPAYIGSGMAEESAQEYIQQAQAFERLFKRCKYKNKYTITYPAQSSTDFKRAFEQLIKSQGCKVTNQKNDGMTPVLKLPHFVHQDGMAQVQIGCGGVETRLDTQRTATFELFNQFFFEQYLFRAATDFCQCLLQGHGVSSK